ncbi:diguanylate cyclase [Pseudoalteromonas sp. McH1-7]|uniref:tetratricopeptide repeat-containing diguanylate cyclase n=1 Tax=Pseudoalteromonas sp. McH1-7 TaxID=2745574 RepID=UPI0015902667|nr:tetratricopeptide repeat-containing diguanylate cyclase [Pseudoalteromonas sp. McH1-7]NUZ12608.1 diguanylate cyclase [Pseudoalteromonas sp. McH1-7]
MYKKVSIALLLTLLLLLVVATLDTFWFHQADKATNTGTAKWLTPEAQLKRIAPDHPLLSIYERAKTEPATALKALSAWRESRQSLSHIEQVYLLWTQRRAAQKMGDDTKFAQIKREIDTFAVTNQLDWLAAWSAQEDAKRAIRAGELAQAQLAIEHSVNLAKSAQAELLLLEIYNTAGVAYNATNDLIKAQQYFLHGIKLVGAYPESDFNALFNNNLGLLYVHLEQWQNALLHLGKAQELYALSPNSNPNYMLVILLNQSFAYGRLGQLSDAREKFQQALTFKNKQTSEFYKAILLKNEARLLLLEGDTRLAIAKAQLCIQLAKQEVLAKQQGICALIQAQALYQQNSLDEAAILINQATQIFTTLNHQRWLLRSQFTRSQILEGLGESSNALNVLKAAHTQEKAMIIGQLSALNSALEIQQIAQERDLLSAKHQLSKLELLVDKQRLRLLALWLFAAVIILIWLGVNTRLMRKDNRRLHDLSYRDPLTGASNRRLYHQEIHTPSMLDKKAEYHLVIIDLDHFKRINDTYGHDKGDIVLAIAAARLQRFVQPQELFIRWGGEEFLMVLKARENIQDAVEKMASALRSEPFELGELRISVTASFGVSASRPIANLDDDSAFKAADQCLYRAKELGRDRVEVQTKP